MSTGQSEGKLNVACNSTPTFAPPSRGRKLLACYSFPLPLWEGLGEGENGCVCTTGYLEFLWMRKSSKS